MARNPGDLLRTGVHRVGLLASHGGTAGGVAERARVTATRAAESAGIAMYRHGEAGPGACQIRARRGSTGIPHAKTLVDVPAGQYTIAALNFELVMRVRFRHPLVLAAPARGERSPWSLAISSKVRSPRPPEPGRWSSGSIVSLLHAPASPFSWPQRGRFSSWASSGEPPRGLRGPFDSLVFGDWVSYCLVRAVGHRRGWEWGWPLASGHGDSRAVCPCYGGYGGGGAGHRSAVAGRRGVRGGFWAAAGCVGRACSGG